MTRRFAIPAFYVATTAALASATFAARAETGSSSTGASEWTLEISPYFWMAGLDGEAGVGNLQADVDLSFSDILNDLQFGGMLLADARKNRFGIFFAPLFVRTFDEAEAGLFDIDVTSDTAVVGGGVFYRIVEWTIGRTGEGQARKAWVDPLAGARWTYLRLELDGDGPLGRHVDQHESWVDPFFGVRVGIDLSERWLLVAEGDVGGFGVGSDFTWNALAVLGYRITFLGTDTILGGGYRALSWDYEDGDFKWDVTMHGPFIGASFRF
ncbi:MAG TPA: hypothetical protein VED46_12990 [Alphaproteobacteria bacterium]|nr:hypothetical protein [Alphaproteobacteria bacterium]